MLGLITDRDQRNVDRRAELAKKGLSGMTAEELIEWNGDPMLSEGGANLIPPHPVIGTYSTADVDVKFMYSSITLTALTAKNGLYVVIPIGKAEYFEGKTLTLSVDEIYISNQGSPNIVPYWYDSNGSESAYNGGLSGEGSLTFTPNTNANSRANLALFIYCPASAIGDYIRYERLMLEFGNVKHKYTPYMGILPTEATKGAYNYSDLNRIELAVAELAEKTNIALTTKTNWVMWDIPTESELERILENVKALREHYSVEAELPNTMVKLTYIDANNIEKVLCAVSDKIVTVYDRGELYCGELYCGEV